MFKSTKNTLFIVALSATSLFAQNKNERFDYRSAAQKPDANFYQIVAQKNAEYATLDMRDKSNAKAWKQYCRWKNHWHNRVNRDGNFPNMNQAFFNTGILDAKGSIQPQTAGSRGSAKVWENVGPQTQQNVDNNGYSNYPQMGRLTSFFRLKHPTDINQDVLFVGAPNGGIWKSTDGGNNWSPKTDALASIGISDIKMSPDASFSNYATKPMYAATGDYDGGHTKSIGVIKSTDGGNTWTSTGLTFGIAAEEQTGDILVLNDNTILVGTKSHIKISKNGGTTWTDVAGEAGKEFFFARFAKQGNTIIAVTKQASIYKSDDNGETWAESVTDLGKNGERIATYASSDGKFYVQTQDGQIYTYDAAKAEVKEYGTIPKDYKSQEGYNMALVVEDNFVVNGEVNAYHSLDGGDTWYQSLNGYWEDNSSDGIYVHSDHHRMGRLDNAGQFWTVNDGGLSYVDYGANPSANKKPTIDYKSSKMLITQSYSIAINPKDNESMMMSNQDNDHFSKSGTKWYAVAGGDGVQSAINYNNPNIRYAVGQSGSVIKSNKAFIGEYSGIPKDTFQIPVSEKGNPGGFYFPMEMNKVNPTRIYVGGKDDVYEIIDDNTQDKGIEPMGAGLKFAQSIATHGNGVILAATQEDIKLSTKAGEWSNIEAPKTERFYTSVDFDAKNTSVLYTSVDGYVAAEKVFKTTDGGKNWTNISAGLPNILINKVLRYQNLTEEVLYAATELGVYVKEGTKNWERLGQGMPNVDIKDIEIHYTSDKLVAGSFGRGLWQVGLEKLNPASNQDLAATQNGFNIYPNPVSNDVMNVKIAAEKSDRQYEYKIYNVVGGVVQSGNLNNAIISTNNLLSNTYILQIFNQNEQYFHKFTVQK